MNATKKPWQSHYTFTFKQHVSTTRCDFQAELRVFREVAECRQEHNYLPVTNNYRQLAVPWLVAGNHGHYSFPHLKEHVAVKGLLQNGKWGLQKLGRLLEHHRVASLELSHKLCTTVRCLSGVSDRNRQSTYALMWHCWYLHGTENSWEALWPITCSKIKCCLMTRLESSTNTYKNEKCHSCLNMTEVNFRNTTKTPLRKFGSKLSWHPNTKHI